MSTSIIKDIEIRACRGGNELNSLDAVDAVRLPGGSRPDFTVITITTQDGVKGTSFGFGALDAKAAAAAMSPEPVMVATIVASAVASAELMSPLAVSTAAIDTIRPMSQPGMSPAPDIPAAILEDQAMRPESEL